MANNENMSTILKKFEYAALHPARAMQEWQGETGGKIIGCIPIHNGGAEELIHAAGMLPVGLWGGQTSISRASEYLQAFCCSPMKAVIEFTMNGVYKNLAGIVCPNTCDTMRCIPLLIQIEVPELPVIGLVLPDNRKIDGGIEYLQAEFKKVAGELEKISGNKITDEALMNSIDLYNTHRSAMHEFYDLAAEHLDIITPYYRHMVIKSAFFVTREKHLAWIKQLNEELSKQAVIPWTGHRVIVAGIMAEPNAILEMMEECNFGIVGDDMALGSRQFRTMAPEGDNPYERMARRFSMFEGCSTVHDPEKLRGEIINEMVEKYQADGVIILIMKFCDPEEYDYPCIKTDLEKEGTPSLYLEIEQQMESLGQTGTRLQAFDEILTKMNR